MFWHFEPLAPLECDDLDEDPYIQFEVMETGEDPNSTFSAGTILKVSCTVGYGVNLPNATVTCVHGTWKPIPPQCDACKCNTWRGTGKQNNYLISCIKPSFLQCPVKRHIFSMAHSTMPLFLQRESISRKLSSTPNKLTCAAPKVTFWKDPAECLVGTVSEKYRIVLRSV